MLEIQTILIINLFVWVILKGLGCGGVMGQDL
jgi:hypothetical protein